MSGFIFDDVYTRCALPDRRGESHSDGQGLTRPRMGGSKCGAIPQVRELVEDARPRWHVLIGGATHEGPGISTRDLVAEALMDAAGGLRQSAPPAIIRIPTLTRSCLATSHIGLVPRLVGYAFGRSPCPQAGNDRFGHSHGGLTNAPFGGVNNPLRCIIRRDGLRDCRRRRCFCARLNPGNWLSPLPSRRG